MSKEWEAPPKPKADSSDWEAPPGSDTSPKVSAVERMLELGRTRGMDPRMLDALEALKLSMARTGTAMGQLVTEPFGSDYYRKAGQAIESDLQQIRERSPFQAGTGEVAGTIASMPVPGIKAATGMKGLLQAAGLGGAMSAASEPVLEGELASGKAEQAIKGGALGAAFQKGAQMLDPALDRLRALTNLGVDVEGLRKKGTLGQLLGGPVETFEKFLERVSFSQLGRRQQEGAKALKEAVDAANLESQMSFSTPLINKALAPLKQEIPTELRGYEAIQGAEKIISDGYADALNRIKAVTLQPQHEKALINILDKAQQDFGLVAPDLFAKFKQDLTKLVSAFDQNNRLNAQVWNKDREELGSQAFKFRGSDNPFIRDAGKAYREVQKVWMNMADDADPTGKIRAANQAYSAMQPLYRAAGYVNAAKAREGAFTPQELLTASKAERPKQFSFNRAPFQKEAIAGAERLKQLSEQRGNILGQVTQASDPSLAGKLIPPVAGLGSLVTGNVSPTMAAVGAAPSLLSMGYASTPMQAALKAMFAKQRPGLQQGALRPAGYGAAATENSQGGLR